MGKIEKGLGLILGVALVALVAACAYLTTPQGQATVQLLVYDSGRVLCASLNAEEKTVAKDVVTQIETGILSVDAVFAHPDARYLAFVGPAWYLLNGLVGGLVPAQYAAVLPASEKSLVDGCASALGVSLAPKVITNVSA